MERREREKNEQTESHYREGERYMRKRSDNFTMCVCVCVREREPWSNAKVIESFVSEKMANPPLSALVCVTMRRNILKWQCIPG